MMTRAKLNALREKSRWAREKYYQWTKHAENISMHVAAPRSAYLKMLWYFYQHEAEKAVMEWIAQTPPENDMPLLGEEEYEIVVLEEHEMLELDFRPKWHTYGHIWSPQP